MSLPTVYPVHRLDRGTGGLVILARNPASASLLSGMIGSGGVRKTYLAVVQATEIPASGTLEDYLFHDRTKNKTYIAGSQRKGVRKAVCSYELLATVQAEPLPLHLVRISLHTGRTHQIRIQFASRGMPVCGDRRYGSRFPGDFPALWASSLSFCDPKDPERRISCVSAPPDLEPWNRFALLLPGGEADFHALP